MRPVLELDGAELDGPMFDGPITQRGIGIIALFDLALDRELWRWCPLDLSLHRARTSFEPGPVSVEMAHWVSDTAHLTRATHDVFGVEPEAVAYLCNSGSFISGLAYERSLREAIESAGAPCALTTSGALVEAVRVLNLTRISVITPYDELLILRLHTFLDELGVQIAQSNYLGVGGGIWRVNYRTVAERIIAADSPDAEAIFVSCTNLPTYDVIEPLERKLGKPVLTANQLTMWPCLPAATADDGPGNWLGQVFGRTPDHSQEEH